MAFLWRPQDPVAWTSIEIRGPDARDFLHRITTADVRPLAPGMGTPALVLDPPGRIRASFELWCLDPNRFEIELDAGVGEIWKNRLLETLEQLHFSENLEIVPIGQTAHFWIIETERGGDSKPMEVRQEPGLLIHDHGSKMFGHPWVTIRGDSAHLLSWIESHFPKTRNLSWEELERLRITAGSPWPGREITGEHSPLEVGLRHAIALSKGCYPGQEVIEKTISIGSPARRLARIKLNAVLDCPALLLAGDPPVPCGTLTSLSKSETSSESIGLAILKKTHARVGSKLSSAHAQGEVILLPDEPL